MSKRKIVILTPGSYIDTDITVVKHLQKEYQVVWYIVQKIGEEKFMKQSICDFVKGSGIELHYHAHTCRFRSQTYRRMMFQYMSEMVAMKADLIYTALQDFYFFLAYILKGRKIPLVMGIHDVERHSSQKLPKGTELVRRLNRMIADELVLFSANQYHLFCKKYPQYKSHCVGMSLKDFGEPTISRENDKSIRKLVLFGSLNHYKGVDLLIQAFEDLLDEGVTNLRLAIYGKFSNEETKNTSLNLIRHKEYYDLHFSFVENKDIANVFNQNDITVFPYRDATQSGPLMINVRYGHPIVAPNHTCFADIYTDECNAFLYQDSLDYCSLKEALRKVSLMTESKYEQMLGQCKILREKYSEENIARNYLNVFKRWIK